MSQKKISPLAPKVFPKLPIIPGIEMGVTSSYFYDKSAPYKGRDDLLFFTFAPKTKMVGVLTKSSMPAAPIDWCRTLLPKGKARGLVINAGNANAFTGKKGSKSVLSIAKTAANILQTTPENIVCASTGVIGEVLEPKPIEQSLKHIAMEGFENNIWTKAASAIMTTDTFPKMVTRQVKIGNTMITLNGIAKGSGMIAPDMATMLGFFFTDANLPISILRGLLKAAVDESFNCITVDSDMSTSDMVLLFSTGQSLRLDTKDNPIKSIHDKRLKLLSAALKEACQDLAQQIIRDGEGASKFITVKVKGAKSDMSARKIALSIANSPLVKTAIAGEDANWGRLVMAVGKSGEPALRDKLKISMGGIMIARNGCVVKNYDERLVAEHMQKTDIIVEVDIGLGNGKAQIWSSDLTHEYVTINADYRS